jgi:hemerythrin
MQIKTAVVSKHEKHVTWSDRYSMGIKVIDDQHKGLLDIVNDLFNHASGDEYEEREYFKSVIQEAVKYIKVHFETEEKLMTATKFPGYAEYFRKIATRNKDGKLTITSANVG